MLHITDETSQLNFFYFLLRYGPIFRTSLAGYPVVVSTDPEFNHHIAKQEGRLVELWYLDAYSKIFTMEGESKTTAHGLLHRYLRSIILNHCGAEALEKMLLSQIEELVIKALQRWSSQPSVEVKHAASVVSSNFPLYRLISSM